MDTNDSSTLVFKSELIKKQGGLRSTSFSANYDAHAVVQVRALLCFMPT